MWRRITRAGSRPGRRPTFLLVQASRQRSTPRLPGPSGYPRCGRPAGPLAKLAGQKTAVVGQRDRTPPGEPPSLGGSEGNERRRARRCSLAKMPDTSFNPFQVRFAGSVLHLLASLRRGNMRMKCGISKHWTWRAARLMACFPSCRQATLCWAFTYQGDAA